VHERPDTDRPGRALFNGRDLTGWRTEGKVEWAVENGAIVARDGDGYLFTEDSFQAFEFQVYFRTTTHANGGVFYRVTDAPASPASAGIAGRRAVHRGHRTCRPKNAAASTTTGSSTVSGRTSRTRR
jgi:hypothetical protein